MTIIENQSACRLHRTLSVTVATAVMVSARLAAADAPAPHHPVPSERQLAWHRMEYYGFVHFTTNTFTDKEWGYGDERPAVFNPSQLDCRQWARVARDAGMGGLILTAKHHDGFCLWPSKHTEHSVKKSPWRDGHGDVVRELSDACREYGLKFGVYLSPWDRNHPEYARDAYVSYYHDQLRELLSNYGELFMVWLDGANGGTGHYGGADERRDIDAATYYRFPEVFRICRRLQPSAVIFGGPDVRWIGNEEGHAPDTCWAKFNGGAESPGLPSKSRLAHGDSDGDAWLPAEVDVSIRPGWFFHANEEPKSLTRLLEIYYQSVGRGCCLNLNITPDRRGLIPEADAARLRELRRLLESTFQRDLARGKPAHASSQRAPAFAAANLTDGDRATYWAAEDNCRQAELVVDFDPPISFNRLRIDEYIPLGQRVEAFAIDAYEGGVWRELATATTIGARRILVLPTTRAAKLRVRILKSQACPLLSTIEAYLATEEPTLGLQLE